MKRTSTTAPRAPLPLDPAKEQRLRRWACKIAAELPSSRLHEALVVLKYAERLLYWPALDDPLVPPMKRGRLAR